uniref:Uncharacterized protein n=1 Tax=Rhizophora mucronata TaxID=61149 RepID=A0A2P2Q018_RHIMU
MIMMRKLWVEFLNIDLIISNVFCPVKSKYILNPCLLYSLRHTLPHHSYFSFTMELFPRRPNSHLFPAQPDKLDH